MNAVITIQEAVILRGQRAWGRIKTTAAEQRQLWREVGEALNFGRALQPSDRGFKSWCDTSGFDMKPDDRSDAMWLAKNWDAVVRNDSGPGLTHPHAIRAAHRAVQASQAPSPDLDISAPAEASLERLAKVIPVASKVRKLAAHAAGTGPEAETARKYLRKQADSKGLSVEEMVDTANKLDPLSMVSVDNRPLVEQAAAALAEHTLMAMAVIQHNGLTVEYLIAVMYMQLKAKGL